MTRRVVVGRRNGGDYGMFVGEPGVDAFTAPDQSLIFSTSMLHASSVHQSGFVGLNGQGWTGWVSFPSLPYIPLIVAGYYDVANARYYFSQQEISAWAGGSWGGITFGGVGPKLEILPYQFRAQSYSDHGADWAVKYYVLRVPGGG